MKFSQGKIMSIVFLLAIMLIALMFSMYESEGFFEGARGRNKQQDKRITGVETRVSALETRVGALETQDSAQSVSNEIPQ
jgi:hypothetical protein